MKLKLEIRIKNNHLFHILFNEGDKEIRFWENNNSWGWGNTQICLISNKVKIVINQKPKNFTRNGPSYFVISPYSSHEFDLDFNDNNWELNLIPNNFKKDEITIFSKIIIEKTEESQEFGVFTGKLKSNKLKLHPPHI